jgi:hypothetical protein
MSQLRGSDQVPLPFDLVASRNAVSGLQKLVSSITDTSTLHKRGNENSDNSVLKLHTKEKLFKQAHNVRTRNAIDSKTIPEI